MHHELQPQGRVLAGKAGETGEATNKLSQQRGRRTRSSGNLTLAQLFYVVLGSFQNHILYRQKTIVNTCKNLTVEGAP